MNELYNETVTRHGKIYHYDPDQDIYYCRYDASTTSTFDRWGWIVITVIMLALALYWEFYPLR